MANMRARMVELVPGGLMKVAVWLHRHPQVVELLMLAAVIGLIALEDNLIKVLAL